MKKFKKQVLNLRPYSWIDLVLLGYLVKFSGTKELIFSVNDLILIACLLSIWFFFNLCLEIKHNYQERGKTGIFPPLVFLVFVAAVGIYKNIISLIPLTISCILILVYLQKNRNKSLGILSSVIRGLIEVSFFVFAITLIDSHINKVQFLLLFPIFLIYTSRAILGDIRDIKHNREANKQTIPVLFGILASKLYVAAMLLFASAIIIFCFGSPMIVLPMILFATSLLFFSNGYVLHQLMILTTSFFSVNFIAFLTNQSLILLNLIYLGIFLNLIFYPILERKSNPKFVDQD